jgi:hypothetical protein
VLPLYFGEEPQTSEALDTDLLKIHKIFYAISSGNPNLLEDDERHPKTLTEVSTIQPIDLSEIVLNSIESGDRKLLVNHPLILIPHHYYVYYTKDGKKSPVYTYTSNSGKEINDRILSEMAKQCKPREKIFSNLPIAR